MSARELRMTARPSLRAIQIELLASYYPDFRADHASNVRYKGQCLAASRQDDYETAEWAGKKNFAKYRARAERDGILGRDGWPTAVGKFSDTTPKNWPDLAEVFDRAA